MVGRFPPYTGHSRYKQELEHVLKRVDTNDLTGKGTNLVWQIGFVWFDFIDSLYLKPEETKLSLAENDGQCLNPLVAYVMQPWFTN